MFIGVDPDLHNTAVAHLYPDGSWQLVIMHVDKGLTGRDAIQAMAHEFFKKETLIEVVSRGTIDAVAVEAQEIYQFGAGRTKNPKSIMYLATVAGLALARYTSASHTFFPPPQEWKGNVPKIIHQARTLSKCGFQYERSGTLDSGYCYPVNTSFGFKKTEWKHLVDAMGLALYAKEQFELARDRQAAGWKGELK